MLCWGGGGSSCPRSTTSRVMESPPSAHQQLWVLPPTFTWQRQGLGAAIICTCKFVPGSYCKLQLKCILNMCQSLESKNWSEPTQGASAGVNRRKAVIKSERVELLHFRPLQPLSWWKKQNQSQHLGACISKLHSKPVLKMFSKRRCRWETKYSTFLWRKEMVMERLLRWVCKMFMVLLGKKKRQHI